MKKKIVLHACIHFKSIPIKCIKIINTAGYNSTATVTDMLTIFSSGYPSLSHQGTGSSLLASYSTIISSFITLIIDFFKKVSIRELFIICTRFHLCTKILEYRIKISAHGVIKGYKMKYKVKCECLIIHRGSEDGN